MNSLFNEKREPNRLMQILICLSVGIHVVIFMHIAGIYKSSAIDYIEFSLENFSKSFSRSIPRPVYRPEKKDQPEDYKKIRVNKKYTPRIEPTKIDPAETPVSGNLMAQISIPELPSDINAANNTYNIGEILDTTGEFSSAKNYYEIVILKIETSKKYPEQAKNMQKEGRVTVGFTLTLQGNVKNIRIIKSCQHRILDQAAIQAVKDAAPFPRPPFRFFKKPVPLELNIVFETT